MRRWAVPATNFRIVLYLNKLQNHEYKNNGPFNNDNVGNEIEYS